MTFCELARRAGEVGCCDKHSLGRFRRTQAPAKRTDFWLAYRGVLFVPLGNERRQYPVFALRVLARTGALCGAVDQLDSRSLRQNLLKAADL